jgi:hypothetical protein
MIPERDDANFAALVGALGPYLDRVVIIGGWAHRLFRNHPLAQPVPYAPLMTRDTDIAVAPGIRPDEQSLRERLLSHGFHEEFLGDDRPPVTHYHLSRGDVGFYVEFLTPLVGGEFTRAGARDVTKPIVGVSAQKLRHLDVLLIAPWSVQVHRGGDSARVVITNPVSYIVQKLLVSDKRKASERAKDVLYIHDTLETIRQVVARPEGALGRPSATRAWKAHRGQGSASAATALRCRHRHGPGSRHHERGQDSVTASPSRLVPSRPCSVDE